MHTFLGKGLNKDYEMERVYKIAQDHVISLIQTENNDEKRILKSSLTTLIRKWCDCRSVDFVSKKAKSQADILGVDLFTQQWKDQPKFDQGRKIFHLEHKYPVSDMIRDMLLEPSQVEDIFNKSQFGWILKSEDILLSKYNRTNHTEEYEAAGIQLLYS